MSAYANAAAPGSRMIGLDLLRLLAVLMVIGAHAEACPYGAGPLKSTFDAWRNCGGLAVDLFFVLSGFLVSGLLMVEYQKRGEVSVTRFYARRAWRIYPPFYAMIVFSYLFTWLVLGERMLDSRIYTELFFLQNYRQAYWNHTWTLALEEHFYILLPLALWAMVRLNRGASDPFRAMPYLVAASSLGILAVRAVNFAVREEYSYHTHAWATHLRIDALFFGVGIAYAYHFHRERFERLLRPWRYALIALGTAMFTTSLWLGIGWTPFYLHTLGFTQFYLAGAALLTGVLMCRIPASGVTTPLARLGAHSYSIYLWHMALMYWLIPTTRSVLSWEARMAIHVAGALAIGLVMAKVVEAPMLRMRDRGLSVRTSDGLATTAPAVRQAA